MITLRAGMPLPTKVIIILNSQLSILNSQKMNVFSSQ